MEKKQKKPPHERCLVLIALRHRRGWTQDQLAETARISSKMISQYESGERVPPQRKLQHFATVLGFAPEEVECALFALEVLCDPEGPEIASLSPQQRREIRRRTASAGLAEARALRGQLVAEAREERWREERKQAEPHARRLIQIAAERGTNGQADMAIAKVPPSLAWAVIERLAAESLRTIVIEPRRALLLAGLGCRVARGPKACPRLQAHALAFQANALRVLGDLAEADQTFKLAGRLLKRKGAIGGGPGLPAWRFLDLQASLRRDQRRFKEALALSDQALAAAPAAARGQVLLNQAAVHQQMGNAERAIEVLREAAPRIQRAEHPRMAWVLQYNLAVNLIDLGQPEAAVPLLAEVREMALDLGNEADVARCVWMQGRLDAALGRRDEAISALVQARKEFTALQLPCDVAGVALHEAILRLEAGELAAVRTLSQEIYWACGARGVSTEAVVALTVFCTAAAREEVALHHATAALKALGLGRAPRVGVAHAESVSVRGQASKH